MLIGLLARLVLWNINIENWHLIFHKLVLEVFIGRIFQPSFVQPPKNDEINTAGSLSRFSTTPGRPASSTSEPQYLED